MPNDLLRLNDSGTRLIIDTAKFHDIKPFKSIISEATTNPSLILLAAQDPVYASLLAQTKTQSKPEDFVSHLTVSFGVKILQTTNCVRVSTQLDPRLSFNTQETITSALKIIDLYATYGIPRSRVRIKIAATWEGIQAAKILEKEYEISVLITVVFGLAQAILAAEAGVTAIAPYVGRIGDWYRDQDRGVKEVRRMHAVFRKRGYRTQIMGASFRNTGQCMGLMGVDMLTIGPKILEELEVEDDGLGYVEDMNGEDEVTEPPDVSTESAFRWAFNSDACAVEKTAEALRRFTEDTEKIETLLREL